LIDSVYKRTVRNWAGSGLSAFEPKERKGVLRHQPELTSASDPHSVILCSIADARKQTSHRHRLFGSIWPEHEPAFAGLARVVR
jgi:hypothetical protein